MIGSLQSPQENKKELRRLLSIQQKAREEGKRFSRKNESKYKKVLEICLITINVSKLNSLFMKL